MKHLITKKPLRLKEEIDTFTFTEFSIGGTEKKGKLISYDSKNCSLVDGSISRGVGISYFSTDSREGYSIPTMASKIEKIFFLTEKDTYAQKPAYLTTDGALFAYVDSDGTFQKLAQMGKIIPYEVMDKTEKPYLVFAGERGIYTYEEGEDHLSSTGVTNATTIGCVWKNRFFCVVEPFTVIYSEPLNAKVYTETVEESGRITFPSSDGKIVAMKAFDEHLYIFYEYGVAKLKVGGSPRDFKWTKIGYGGGKIFGNSVAVCSVGGEKAFFLAEDGLYRLHHDVVERVCKNLQIKPRKEGQVCVQASSEGKYLLQYLSEDEGVKTVCVDAETEKGYFFFSCNGLSSWRGKTFCVVQNELMLLTCDGELPSWETAYFKVDGLTFGGEENKRVKSLRVFGTGKVRVVISSEGEVKEKILDLFSGSDVFSCNLRGKLFSLMLILEGKGSVTKVTAQTARLRK